MTLAADLLERARLAAAAYVDDRQAREAAIAGLGYAVLDTYENEDHRALFCAHDSGRYLLSLCGTRFSDGNLHELFDDEDVLAVERPFGIKAMAGFHAGMAELYAWAFKLLPAGAQLELVGHSLGGARAHLASLFVDPVRLSQITSFGAPKAANRAFWAGFSTPLRRVVNGRDLWAGYPWLPPWTQPAALYWISGGEIKAIDEDAWPGGLRADHHSIDSGYVRNLEAIVAAAAAAA